MPKTPSIKVITVSLFLIVLIVATFFRLYNLTSAPPGHYPDEAMNGTNAQEAIATGNYKLFYPENNGREGLFINIQAQFLKFFGENEPWVLRSASALFGILTVIGIFLLIRQLYRTTRLEARFGLLAAFLGSFLTAVSFWHIMFSRIGFRAIMAPAFIVWSSYVLLLGCEKCDLPSQSYSEASIKKENKKGYILFAIAGVLFGLGMHSYIAYRATPLFILLIFLVYGYMFSVSFKKMLGRLGIFVLGSLLSTSPLIVYFFKTPQDFFGRTSQISIFSSDNPILAFVINVGKTLLSFFWFGDGNWRHHYANTGQLHPLVSILFVIGIVVGIMFLVRFLKNRKSNDFSVDYVKQRGEAFIFLFATFLFVVALLPTVVSSEGIPHALRAIIMIPAVFILVGVGAAHAYIYFQKKFASKLVWSLSVALLAFITLHTYHLYFVDWAQRLEVKDAFAQNYVDLGHELKKIGPEIPKYVVVNTGGVDVRGLPMPTQTVMFLTDTFTPEKQKEKNLFYVLPQDKDKIPEGAKIFYLQ